MYTLIDNIQPLPADTLLNNFKQLYPNCELGDVYKNNKTNNSEIIIYKNNKETENIVSFDRLLVETHINRLLKDNEVVEHKDTNITNNKINNLRLLIKKDYSRKEILELNYRSRSIIYAMSKGYTIDDFGNIDSPFGNRLNPSVDRKRSKYRKFSINRYSAPYMCSNKIPVHRFQAYKKFGEQIFREDMVVRHLNGNSLDNSWENIGIGTQTDNSRDIPLEKRTKIAIHAASFNRKYYNNEEIKNYYSKIQSYRKTMKKFNISSTSTLHYILNNTYVTPNTPK